MNSTSLRVLVVGGYGGFGRRLVELLSAHDPARILVAGRSFEKAQAFCVQAAGNCEPVLFDRARADVAVLRELRPDIVVDAAGPFQCYGDAPYALVEACLDLGINYLDLADGRDFVCNIARYDAKARDRGVFVLSGASSVPALSGAAIHDLATRFDRVDRIEIGITPAGGVLMGNSVVRAILSYLGQTVQVLEEGEWQTRYCWTDLRAERLEVGNNDRLNKRWFSLCDVPDLALWPARFESVRSVSFGAAVEPAFNHLGLFALAWLVRLGLLRSAESLSPLLQRAVGWMPAGVRKGGMFVRVSGDEGGGALTEAQWTLIADGDHGPYIPAMAAAALIGKTASGSPPDPGARACTDALELADFSAYFSRFDIRTSIA